MKLATPISIFTLALSTLSSAIALPQDGQLVSHTGSNSPYNLVQVRSQTPGGRTFTEDLYLDRNGEAWVSFAGHDHDNRVVASGILRSPQQYPTLRCFIYATAAGYQSQTWALQPDWQFPMLPFSLATQAGMVLDQYFVGEGVRCKVY